MYVNVIGMAAATAAACHQRNKQRRQQSAAAMAAATRAHQRVNKHIISNRSRLISITSNNNHHISIATTLISIAYHLLTRGINK